MNERITISAARNIFFGGTIFFFAVFVLLVVQTVYYVNDEASNSEQLNEKIALGKGSVGAAFLHQLSYPSR